MKPSGHFFTGRKNGLLLLLVGLALGLVLMWIGIKYEHINLGFKDVIGIMLKKIELISRMRASLLTSADAEKSAVMADTDEASRAFADQSRQAADAVDRDRRELGLLVEKDHTEREMELLREFDSCWAELRKIDQVLLDLAVENTNLKAANLSFGKGSLAVKRFEEALTGLKGSEALSRKNNQIAELVCNALTAGLKIHYLQAPHIVAANDDQMDKIEAEIGQQNEVIKSSLSKLEQLVPKDKQASLAEAEAAYDELTKVAAEVVNLSRQNTNIKSFELSLGRKRKVTAQCDEILKKLEEAVRSKAFTGTR
jgi:hypothetical protein